MRAELNAVKSFIGCEMLTWLWWKSAQGEQVAGCSIELLSPLKLAGRYGDARELMIKGDSPATSPESHRALAEGKILARVPMTIKQGDLEYRARLDGKSLSFSLNGMVAKGMPLNDRVTIRVKDLMGFHQATTAILREFCEVRFDDARWPATVEAMRQWITEESGR